MIGAVSQLAKCRRGADVNRMAVHSRLVGWECRGLSIGVWGGVFDVLRLTAVNLRMDVGLQEVEPSPTANRTSENT